MTNGNRFNRTYEISPNPPPRMSWEEYSKRVLAEWHALLNSEQGCEERQIHNFLVRHPSMVPGAYSVTGPSGHSPLSMALLSESPLTGIDIRIPDFIWLANDSLNFTPVFIEIESPCKRWFTQAGDPTHDLAQAHNQLVAWRNWFNRPENVMLFFNTFRIPDGIRRDYNFRPEFVLIYGRRVEFEDRPELTRFRAQFEQHGQIVMTFDRLKPAGDCEHYLSARVRNGDFHALHVPATFQLGPMVAEEFAGIRNIDGAIELNEWISAERRRFLIERLEYWNNWARRDHKGTMNTGDWE